MVLNNVLFTIFIWILTSSLNHNSNENNFLINTYFSNNPSEREAKRIQKVIEKIKAAVSVRSDFSKNILFTLHKC